VQESRAEKSIEALQKMASPHAKVLRAGKITKIESRYLVPGDIIILETGDKVPADARLIEIHELQTQEASLTGESNPLTKSLEELPSNTSLAERKNMLYASTIITKGRGKAIVTSTGMHTEIGKIAQKIQEHEEKSTPLQHKIKELGKYFTIIVIIIAIVIFLGGIFLGEPLSEMFLMSIALAVAAIPEGLPAVITICLALGVQRMAKKNALMRNLPSVETLGSVSVICADKTGTLTPNQMTVREIFANQQLYEVSGSGYEKKGEFYRKGKEVSLENLELLLKCGALCNDAQFNAKELIGDPTEAALLISAEKAGIKVENMQKKEPRIDEISFTSERKMMTTIHRADKKIISYTKGSPELILELCDRILINGTVKRLNRDLKKEILRQNNLLAEKALRVLAFAYNENCSKAECEKKMTFLGLQAMIDPPRAEVKQSIKQCQEAGIRVIMITGDQLGTAQAIAKELGIFGAAISGEELEKIKNLESKIDEINIFARVNPEHKLKIVRALQNKGYFVAMTGDGVNDAPALKKADIGIAMGLSGTDVAKEASDMILTDDHFTSIVKAVEEGRGIFENIRKFVNYLLSCNLGEISLILFASLYAFLTGTNLVLPLTAIQILWINLITDGLPATALSLDQPSQKIMQKPPRAPKESILTPLLKKDIILFGVLMGLASFVLFLLYQNSGQTKFQTMVFTSLVLFEMVRLMIIRREYQLKLFSNLTLVAAVLISFVLQLIVIYTPLSNWFKTESLGIFDWLVLIVSSLVLWAIYLICRKILEKFWKK